MIPIRLFLGYDSREAIGFHTCVQSIIENTTVPVAITPLAYDGAQRDGTNAFTYTRFIVPELCNWAGWAIFLDGADMLCAADLKELWDEKNPAYAAMVVKHDYKTKFPRKYLGTEMEADNHDYPRKNWSSVILWNCGHMANFKARDEMRSQAGSYLHRFQWLRDDQIGELAPEWNWLADEYGANALAKIVHYTAGIPAIPAHSEVAHAIEWRSARTRAQQSPAAARRIAEVASAR